MVLFTVHMSEKEAVHWDDVHNAIGDEEKRKEYRRQWMARKRAEEKLNKELREDRAGEVSLASVEKEAVLDSATKDETGVVGSEPAVEVPRTRSDVKFERDRPGYYIFQKDVIERACWKCGDKFETRLEMNKFCGPKCKEGWLSDAFGKLRSQSKPNL